MGRTLDVPAIFDVNCLFGHWPRGCLDASLPTVLSLLRRAGIQSAVVASLRGALYDDTMGNEETQRVCREYPNLVPAGYLCLRRTLDVERDVAALAARGFRVLRLGREWEGWPMDYAPLRLALRAASKVGIPVIIAALAPGDLTALARQLEEAGPVIVTGVNVSHTPLAAEAVAVARDCPWLHLETSRLEGVGTLELLMDAIGVSRLVFGSGVPFQYPSSALSLVLAADISGEDRSAILAGNLQRLLGPHETNLLRCAVGETSVDDCLPRD